MARGGESRSQPVGESGVIRVQQHLWARQSDAEAPPGMGNEGDYSAARYHEGLAEAARCSGQDDGSECVVHRHRLPVGNLNQPLLAVVLARPASARPSRG